MTKFIGVSIDRAWRGRPTVAGAAGLGVVASGLWAGEPSPTGPRGAAPGRLLAQSGCGAGLPGAEAPGPDRGQSAPTVAGRVDRSVPAYQATVDAGGAVGGGLGTTVSYDGAQLVV